LIAVILSAEYNRVLKKKERWLLLLTTMASLARSFPQTLRAASRRAPSALAKSTVKPAQFASYSSLARAVAAKSAQPVAVRV
jgi:hypothetical protein